MEPPPRRSLAPPALDQKLAADLRELRAIAGADLRAIPCLLPLTLLPPCTPHPTPPATTPHPGTATAHRARSLPAQTEHQHWVEEPGVSPSPPPPPQAVSMPELPPPGATAVALDLQRLTQRAPSDAHRLPPLLAALTRRPRDDARLRWLRRHQTQELGTLPAPPLALGVSLLRRPEPAESAVWLRVQPPLCPEPAEVAAAEAEAVPDGELWALYERLAAALPGERLRFEHEPLVQPAATGRDLDPEGLQGTGAAARGTPPARRGEPRNASLLQDYLRYLEGTGSDFLHTIFNLGSGEEEEEVEEAVKAPRGAAEPGQPAAGTPVTPAGLQQLQRRLQQLWAALLVPGRQRLAMATKYADGAALARLPAALELWEEAASLIRQREQLLAWLEGLEVRASDPNRFFCRAPKAFAARAGEARARGRLRAAVAGCEGPLRATLRRLREEFGDEVTLRGRPYEEKMRWDGVEMLYRLQQGRRAGALGAMLRHRGAEMSPGGAGGM